MLTKNQVKELRLLAAKKHRIQLQKYIAEGEKIVAEIIDLMPSSLVQVLCTESYKQVLSQTKIAQLGTRLLTCAQSTLDSISALSSPSPVMAVMQLSPASRDLRFSKELGLYLDGIRDPGNLGTILRIADWFGLPVFLSEDCVDVYNPKVIQASMGAFLRVATAVGDLSELRIANPAVQILGTNIDRGEDALSFAWPAQAVLVIGSESHGIREASSDSIDRWLSIPRGTAAGGSESLNAAVATGILCASHLGYRRSH